MSADNKTIAVQGAVRVNDKEYLYWYECPHCHKTMFGTMAIETLNADAICNHCGKQAYGTPTWRNVIGYKIWEEELAKIARHY